MMSEDLPNDYELTEADYLEIERARAVIDLLLRERSWLDAAYADPDQHSQSRREVAQRSQEVAIELQLQYLLVMVYQCTTIDMRDKLRREYLRKRMTLRPPARPWLRYLVVAGAAVVIAYAIVYLLPW